MHLFTKVTPISNINLVVRIVLIIRSVIEFVTNFGVTTSAKSLQTLFSIGLKYQLSAKYKIIQHQYNPKIRCTTLRGYLSRTII